MHAPEPPSHDRPRRNLRSLFTPLLLMGTMGLWLALGPDVEAAPAGGSEVQRQALGWLVGMFCLLLVGSGLVSSSETALFSLDKLDLARLRGSRNRLDGWIVALLERPNDTLITILVFNNAINISVSLAAAAAMDVLFTGSTGWAFTMAALVATTGILLVGEIIPKMLANLHPVIASRLLVTPLMAANGLIWPVRVSIKALLDALYRVLRIPEGNGSDEFSDHELKAVISSGEVSQVLQADEREMIDGVFELRRTVADEILTPRTQVQAVPDDLGQEEMRERLREARHNRVLVYHDSLDQLLGYVLVKEVLLDTGGHWRDHLREALCVPERVGLLDLLKLFRQKRTKMAVVVDEFGGVAGIVSLQDLLEEIVGDIYELHEPSVQDLVALDEHRWRVTGSIELADLGDTLGVEFPGEMGRTLGGLVMNTLGHIPQTGDEISHADLRIRVEKMVGRRVHQLLVERTPPEPEAPPEGEPPREGDA